MTPDELTQYLRNFIDGFDFTRPGQDQSLGRDIALLEAERIGERGRQDHTDEHGAIWLALDPEYATEKQAKYDLDPDEVNIRTGQMLSKLSIAGNITIAPREVLIGYGTGQPPSSSAAPNQYISDADKQVTDVQKAEWAHKGGPGRPARTFMGVGEGDFEAIVELCQENLNDYILADQFGKVL